MHSNPTAPTPAAAADARTVVSKSALTLAHSGVLLLDACAIVLGHTADAHDSPEYIIAQVRSALRYARRVGTRDEAGDADRALQTLYGRESALGVVGCAEWILSVRDGEAAP